MTGAQAFSLASLWTQQPGRLRSSLVSVPICIAILPAEYNFRSENWESNAFTIHEFTRNNKNAPMVRVSSCYFVDCSVAVWDDALTTKRVPRRKPVIHGNGKQFARARHGRQLPGD